MKELIGILVALFSLTSCDLKTEAVQKQMDENNKLIKNVNDRLRFGDVIEMRDHYKSLGEHRDPLFISTGRLSPDGSQMKEERFESSYGTDIQVKAVIHETPQESQDSIGILILDNHQILMYGPDENLGDLKIGDDVVYKVDEDGKVYDFYSARNPQDRYEYEKAFKNSMKQ